jgi:hypothetical protein
MANAKNVARSAPLKKSICNLQELGFFAKVLLGAGILS